MASSSALYDPQIVVTGDVTMDWNIACARPTSGDAGWTGPDSETRIHWQRGGAALLADLVTALADHIRARDGIHYELCQPSAPLQAVIPGDPRFHHTYSQWNQFPKTAAGQGQVWRMAEWLGMERSKGNADANAWAHVVGDTARAQIVMLDDADLGFRDHPELWPLALQSELQPWILLKMAQPVAQGALWERLQEDFSDRLIVVTTINDLRQSEVQISRELSWERTAQDLAWELVYNPRTNSLSRCAYTVVSFGAAGTMMLSRQSEENKAGEKRPPSYHLIFDPTVIEGMWEQNHPGGMSGYTTCLATSIAYQLMRAPDAPDMEQAIQCGLAAIRQLHQEGYGASNGGVSDAPVTFPIKLVVEQLTANLTPFAVAEVQDPGRNLSHIDGVPRRTGRPGLWTILEDRYTGGLEQVAQQIVLQGAEVALQGVPLGRFGALLTVDRQEIESLRSLRALVGEYCHQASPKRPLSIAVFGAPGSGKSFGVTEVARSLLPGQIEKLEFNLSQFDSPRQLLDAFHRVRDTALSGRIPLVFWDEFDSALEHQALGWLRHFLAPMQDGTFQEGQILHPLGRSIFVFAGGTSESMGAFDRGAGDHTFRAAKGPDFISRLKGYINVVGPNPKGGNAESDRYYIVRRAILLRQLLQRNAAQIFHSRQGSQIPQIDSGVLRAFLSIPAYKHGARSMESIVTSSKLTGRSHFERSALPTETQLNLHVDESLFLSLVQQIELSGKLLELLAEAAHDIYRSQIHGQAMRLAEHQYTDLSDEEKEQNRQTVRDIPTKLAFAGYVMRPARSDEPPFDFPDGDREELAELEHERWVHAMLAAGWRCGSETDRAQRIHRLLLPWRLLSTQELSRRYSADELAQMGQDELPNDEREKCRVLIDGIPRILAKAGYTLIKVRAEGQYE